MVSTDLFGLISLAVSVMSAAVSVIFSIRAVKDARLQQRRQLIDIKQSYYSKLQDWGEKVVDILTEAIFLCEYDSNNMFTGEYSKMVITTKQKLSALIDQGRFFLPNESPEKYGTDQPLAYRGFRPLILDHLVEAYNRVDKMNCTEHESNQLIRGQLWGLRKRFVSEVQGMLDPRAREREIKSLLAELSS